MRLQCQVCKHSYEVAGTAGALTDYRCPACGTTSRLVQVPFGRDGRPGMPEGTRVTGRSGDEAVALTRQAQRAL